MEEEFNFFFNEKKPFKYGSFESGNALYNIEIVNNLQKEAGAFYGYS